MKLRQVCVSTLLVWSCTLAIEVAHDQESHNITRRLGPPGSSYPRTLVLSSGAWLTCSGRGGGSLQLALSTDRGHNWSDFGSPVVQAAVPSTTDVANCFLAQTVAGDLLAAFRFHTNCTGEPKICTKYSIRVARSTDDGLTWDSSFAVLTTTSRANGVWEPFLFPVPGSACLDCFYSRERPAGDREEQDIVAQRSCDHGSTWSPFRTVMSTPGSRNGMPSVALFTPNTSHVGLVFEGFWGPEPGWGRFTVQLATSSDGGWTWDGGRTVYAPDDQSHFDAGAPAIAVGGDRVVRVSFMTNYNRETPKKMPPTSWPGSAYGAVISSTGPFQHGQELVFSPPTLVAQPSTYWPNVFQCGDNVAYEFQNNTGTWLIL